MGEPPLPPRRAAWIVASAVPVHFALATLTDLTPDEAYYLSAARLGARIVDHPPLTIWMLAASDHLTALPVELRVRIWAIAASLLTSLAIVGLARKRGASSEGCEIAAWVGTWALLPMAGGFVTTPDTALLLAVAVALLSETLAGPALFVGALAKVVAFPVAALLASVSSSRGRRAALLTMLAPIIAIAFLLPNLAFQLRHAFAGGSGWSAIDAVGAVGGAASAQVLLWSPIAFAYGVAGLRRAPRRDQALFLGITLLVLTSALVRAVPPEPNWWAPAALPLLGALGVRSSSLASRSRRVLLAALLAPTLVAIAHTLHPFLPLPTSADATARLHGWRSGHGPVDAAGVGAYGGAAEACIYEGACEEIAKEIAKQFAK